MRHLSGFGGGRYSLAGHIGPALRMGVVAVYHTPRLGGGRYRGGADRGVRPYGGVSCPYTMQPFVVVIVTMVGRSSAPPLRRLRIAPSSVTAFSGRATFPPWGKAGADRGVRPYGGY